MTLNRIISTQVPTQYSIGTILYIDEFWSETDLFYFSVFKWNDADDGTKWNGRFR